MSKKSTFYEPPRGCRRMSLCWWMLGVNTMVSTRCECHIEDCDWKRVSYKCPDILPYTRLHQWHHPHLADKWNLFTSPTEVVTWQSCLIFMWDQDWTFWGVDLIKTMIRMYEAVLDTQQKLIQSIEPGSSTIDGLYRKMLVGAQL